MIFLRKASAIRGVVQNVSNLNKRGGWNKHDLGGILPKFHQNLQFAIRHNRVGQHNCSYRIYLKFWHLSNLKT